MAVAEGPSRIGNLELQTLQESERPYKEEVTLELNGQPVHIDPVVLSLLRDNEGIQLGVTCDVRAKAHVTLVKDGGIVRTLGFATSREPGSLVDTLHVGLRPSRLVFMNGGSLKATFKKDDLNSLTFTLESTEEIRVVSLPIGIDPRKYLTDLYAPATEEDIEARIVDQEIQYFRYVDEYSRGGKPLSSQWEKWGKRHKFRKGRTVLSSA